jgi:predicted metal-dependent hydrolase
MVQFGLPFERPIVSSVRLSRSDPGDSADAATASVEPPSVPLPERPEQTGVAEVAGPDAPIEFYFVRHHRARRYVLRLDGDGRARVTIPRGGSERGATAFGLRHMQWITGQRASIRRLALSTDERVRLRARADAELPARLLELAALHGLAVVGVSVRDQRTRWGSCGRSGRISLNWRLTLMPEWVRDYVMVHELMHLKRLDHSPEYWRLVADAYPDQVRARSWLRQNGPSLR